MRSSNRSKARREGYLLAPADRTILGLIPKIAVPLKRVLSRGRGPCWGMVFTTVRLGARISDRD